MFDTQGVPSFASPAKIDLFFFYIKIYVKIALYGHKKVNEIYSGI